MMSFMQNSGNNRGSNHASTSGTLPSNTIPNPRNECKGITTRSGVVLDGPLPPMPPPYVNPDNEKAKETEVTKDKVQPESSQSTANIQPWVDSNGKGKDKLKDNEKGMNEKEKDDEVRDSVFEEILIDKEEFFLPKSPPIKPNKPTKTLPYPSRVEYEKKGENDKVQIQKFWEMFKKIHVNITLADALILMPKYQKMLKSLLSNKEKLNEMANTPVSENCSAIILKKLPEKLEDPGQFLIPCTFSELKCKALADLGASINLMPFSVYTKLGLPALQSTRMTLELANCSLCVPKGIARDVLVLVGGRLDFPADFVVVDLSVIMKKDEDPNAIFTSSEVVKCDFLTTNGDPITPPSTIPTKEDLINEKVEKHEELCRNGQYKWSLQRYDEINHEVFKSDNENDLGVHDNEEEEIAFLDGLLEDENFFEMNDKKVESLERKTKEDFETKDEPKFSRILADSWFNIVERTKAMP
ncbi:reverse transcriptase domain-containing protein [Tanacetum coccineum]